MADHSAGDCRCHRGGLGGLSSARRLRVVTLIVVKPSTLPTSVVPTITEDSLTRQLTSIAQVVTSRSSLEPLVEKYELYTAERLRGEPMEIDHRHDAQGH